MIPDNFKNLSWSQKKCAILLRDLFSGWHHVPKIYAFGTGICCNPNSLATWDFDTLTRLVLLCHKYQVRAEIGHSGPFRVKLILHKRKKTGGIGERHPGITELVGLANDLRI